MSDYRSIELLGEPVARLVSGPPPVLAWIDLSEIVIDDSYQRPLTRQSMNCVRRIAGAFDFRRFSPCLVAPIAGGAVCVD